MNMKIMNNRILGCLLCMAALNGMAATISDVVAKQRWPWSRLVDIDYVLTGEAGERVDVTLTAKDGATVLTLPSNSLTGDLNGVLPGLKRIVWDPTQTGYTNNLMLTQFNVTLAPIEPPLYMVIDLSDGSTATAYPVSYYTTEAELPYGGVTNEIYKSSYLVMRRIFGGSFKMGSPGTETGRFAEKEDWHDVNLTKGFYVGVYEVTQSQWQKVMNTWPANFNNADYRSMRPVEMVSYNDIRGTLAQGGGGWPTSNNVYASSFIGRLRTKTGLAEFDLPTDAQWEYACRAGTEGALNNGTANLTVVNNVDANLNLLGRYLYNGGRENGVVNPARNCTTNNATAVVGSYLPNAWGLYDMHGNVWEWCLDWYAASLGTGTVTDPVGANSGSLRVSRGGGWAYDAPSCRSASRYGSALSPLSISIGFRLVRTLP